MNSRPEFFHVIVRPAADSGATCFNQSYEQVADALARIPRLFIEPDGSFVWVSASDISQKIDGQITDDGRHVISMEIKGRATVSGFELICAALRGSPVTPLEFQRLPSGELVSESEFRQQLEDG